jgi:hypothetical protein
MLNWAFHAAFYSCLSFVQAIRADLHFVSRVLKRDNFTFAAMTPRFVGHPKPYLKLVANQQLGFQALDPSR